jgi:hypothetical protein
MILLISRLLQVVQQNVVLYSKERPEITVTTKLNLRIAKLPICNITNQEFSNQYTMLTHYNGLGKRMWCLELMSKPEYPLPLSTGRWYVFEIV